MLASSRGLPRLHDSVDEETLSRGWDRALFEQIARDLALAPPRVVDAASLPVRIPAPPNPFETPRRATDPPPPWVASAWPSSTAWALQASRTTSTAPPARTQRRARRRSKMPWVVLAMTIGIALGLWRDPAARTDVTRELRGAGAGVSSAVHGPLDALHLR